MGHVIVIALTGGIGAGKSTVAARFRELGAVVADADQLAREAVEPGTPGLSAIAERFGASVIAADGTLDRPALGAIVFADEAARRDLNAITHPAVGELTTQRIREAAEKDANAVFVYDVPLLVESGGRRGGLFEYVIVVEAPEAQRVERLMTLRGMSREEAERRVASQASDEQRRALADAVIDASGTVEQTVSQADALWPALVERATASGSGRPTPAE